MKESEIRISMYIVEHNVALRSSDHLISFFKSICPESDEGNFYCLQCHWSV